MLPEPDKAPIQARPCGDPLPQAKDGRPRSHPLGPLLAFVPLESPVSSRLYALGVIAAAILLFAAAARIRPAGSMGTHRQLGLPECGFVLVTGLPCPTCGMTTAYAYTVRGRFAQAVLAQPAGFLLALITAAAGALAIMAVVTGRRPAVNWYRVNPVHCVSWGAAILVGAWAFKLVLGLAQGTLPSHAMH